MKCHGCGTDMKAITYNSDGYSERLVVLDNFNPNSGRYEMVGKLCTARNAETCRWI